MNANTMWYVGNSYGECGEIENIKRNSVFTLVEYRSKTYVRTNTNKLQLAAWTKEIKYCTNITAGHTFNIYTTSLLKSNTYTVFGYVRKLQETLSYKSNNFYIPASIISICIKYYRNKCEYYSAGYNARLNKIESLNKCNISKIRTVSQSNNIFWITDNGQVYYGENKYSLGGATDTSHVYEPVLCSFLQDNSLKCVDAVCEGSLKIMVCDNGSVWSSGYTQFKQIAALSKYTVIAVSAGHCFSMFVCNDGNVWSCGQNSCGQLGLGHSEISENEMSKIEYFEFENIKIIKIVCGYEHTIALDVKWKWIWMGYK
eukprot:209460_1